MSEHGQSPAPVSRQDAETLLGVAVVLEGTLVGEPNPELVKRLARQFGKTGLLNSDSAGRPEVRLALANLNQRLRYALGELASPPEVDVGLIDHWVRFESLAGVCAWCRSCVLRTFIGITRVNAPPPMEAWAEKATLPSARACHG